MIQIFALLTFIVFCYLVWNYYDDDNNINEHEKIHKYIYEKTDLNVNIKYYTVPSYIGREQDMYEFHIYLYSTSCMGMIGFDYKIEKEDVFKELLIEYICNDFIDKIYTYKNIQARKYDN